MQDLSKFCTLEGATEKESCLFLNLIFQFLWKEWRDSPKTRSFFIRKMNMEFQEMLLNKAAGKLMEQIKVKDYYLGDSLPEFKSNDFFLSFEFEFEMLIFLIIVIIQFYSSSVYEIK